MRRREFIILIGGATISWPLVVRAQSRGKFFRIEVLGTIPWTAAVDVVSTLRESLRERGYIEGQNITINFRGPGQISELTAELIDNSVDVIVAWTTPSVLAARRASSKIPIVMVGVADPVALGLVDSLARPGGNVTGLSNVALDLNSKLVELLKEMVPSARRIGVLRSPNNPGVSLQLRETENAIRALELDPLVATAWKPDEFETAFASMKAKNVDVVVLLAEPSLIENAKLIAQLARQMNMPTAFQRRESVEAGGLFSYGPDLRDQFRQAAGYVDRILKGAKPTDLPVQQPTKIEFVINLKTAKALGLTVPPRLLTRADEVIE
jgi:putative tryptophan/tyrosine transport system substrate-binding protein